MLLFEELPDRVANYVKLAVNKGPHKAVGVHIDIKCTECGAVRTLAAARWKYCHKNGMNLRCGACGSKSEDPLLHMPGLYSSVLVIDGLSLSIRGWAKRTGISVSSIYSRLRARKMGKDLTDAEVVYGERLKHKDPMKDQQPIRSVDRLIVRAEEDFRVLMNDTVQRAVEKFFRNDLRRVIYGMLASEGLIGELADTPAQLPQTQQPPTNPKNLLTPKNHKYDYETYDPTPQPNDDEVLGQWEGRDITRRELREWAGDHLLVSMEQRPDLPIEFFFQDAFVVPLTPAERKLQEAEERRKQEQASRFTCLPAHQGYQHIESDHDFLIKTPIPEGLGDGFLLHQEATTPLSEEEILDFIDAPWWKNWVSWTIEEDPELGKYRKWDYRQGVAHPYGCFPTQYDRIAAWHLYTLSDLPAQFVSNKSSSVHKRAAIKLEYPYVWATDHRKLNLILDFWTFEDWIKGQTPAAWDKALPYLKERIRHWRGPADKQFKNFIRNTLVNYAPDHVKDYLDRELPELCLDDESLLPDDELMEQGELVKLGEV